MRTDSGTPHERTGLWTPGATVLWMMVCLLLGLASYLFSKGQVLEVMDFRAFYAAGVIVRQHPSLLFDLATQTAMQAKISPRELLTFYHPAYEALLYAPLSRLSYHAAYFVYMVWNMLLLWACYLAAPLRMVERVRGIPRPALFFLSFPPLLCVFAGQNSLLFLLGLCVIYRCLEERRDLAAGAVLGLVLFKLPIAVPLAFLLAMRRGWRFLAGFLVSAGMVAGLSVAIVGIHGTRDFLNLLGNASLAADHSVQAQKQAAVWLNAMPNVSGLLNLCGTRWLTARGALAVNGAVSLLLLGGSVYLIRKTRREATAFCVALIGAILLSPHLYIYDYSALVLPFLLLHNRWMTGVAALWFVLLPVLFGIGFLTWFAPAIVVPILLLGMCAAEVVRADGGGWRRAAEVPQQ